MPDRSGDFRSTDQDRTPGRSVRASPDRQGKWRRPWWWLFQSGATGRVSILAWPSLPLWMWITTAITRRLPSVDERADALLGIVGTTALVVWGLDELCRGVNPWRRLLGLGVLLGMIVSTGI